MLQVLHELWDFVMGDKDRHTSSFLIEVIISLLLKCIFIYFQNLAPCWSSLTALAIKYASELRTCVEDVLDRLEDIRWWQVTEDTISVYSVSLPCI